MLFKREQIDRERIAGGIIIISVFIILISMVGIRFLDVKVTNIELIDRGLYSVITESGPVNIAKEDILRIERTYTKAAITGNTVELDKIYTTKGFVYISSADPFYKIGSQLIDSIDLEGKPVWIHPYNGYGSDAALDQRANIELVQPFSYAIGTNPKLASAILSILSVQYFALAICGLALSILIFPLRLETPMPAQSLILKDPDFSSDEEQVDAVAK